MEALNNSEKIIIDNHSSYVEFIWAISDCRNYGDKLVVYKRREGDIKFSNYNFFSKCEKGNPNIEILYMSEYIERNLSDEELNNTIDTIIEDIKEKSNIFIDEESAEGVSILPDISLWKYIILLIILGTISMVILEKNFLFSVS